MHSSTTIFPISFSVILCLVRVSFFSERNQLRLHPGTFDCFPFTWISLPFWKGETRRFRATHNKKTFGCIFEEVPCHISWSVPQENSLGYATTAAEGFQTNCRKGRRQRQAGESTAVGESTNVRSNFPNRYHSLRDYQGTREATAFGEGAVFDSCKRRR